MKQRILHGTDISVSSAGLGTVKFGRNEKVKYPTAFSLPSDQDILALLSHAQRLGINLLDTAPAYGNSEERLGKLLKHQRHDWVICSKAGETFLNGESHYNFTPEAIRNSVEHSLRTLQTDYIDILLIHSDGHDEEIIRQYGALDTLNSLKKAGLIRATGMSTKTLAGGLLAVEQSDVVMMTYNPIYTDDRPVLDHAHQLHKAIFVKKALASGHLEHIASQNPVETAMQFIFREPGVTSVILGTLNKEHLAQNIECINSLPTAKS